MPPPAASTWRPSRRKDSGRLAVREGRSSPGPCAPSEPCTLAGGGEELRPDGGPDTDEDKEVDDDDAEPSDRSCRRVIMPLEADDGDAELPSASPLLPSLLARPAEMLRPKLGRDGPPTLGFTWPMEPALGADASPSSSRPASASCGLARPLPAAGERLRRPLAAPPSPSPNPRRPDADGVMPFSAAESQGSRYRAMLILMLPPRRVIDAAGTGTEAGTSG